MAENIEKEIISIISDVSGFDEQEITPEMNFYNDLEIDSIKAIEITVAIEKKFKISVRDEDVPSITTVKQAVNLVNELLKQKATEENKHLNPLRLRRIKSSNLIK